jgi:ATP-dependent DNA helicase RecQ
MSVAESSPDLEQTLRDRFGLERFRPGQREVIEQVIGRRDVLCVMPTGGGKSLCYQLPALLIEGLTLVVSPLIALMKDQVDVLVQRGIRATLLNSTLDPEEQRARILEIEAGRYDLVYVAPERFRSHRFVEAMGRVKPALLAIDEAHCISEWGHDFRPDYARIGHARRTLGMPPCIALTATATDLVRRDIADQLDLQDPAHFVTGFDRPNLRYGVIEARRDEDKLAALARLLDEAPGPAIIYASSRARCEMVGKFLEKELRRSAVVYHAGLGRDERTSAQERFMGGEVDSVVATNAFGMGVDKADIRSVIHFNMPGTLEAYYQEAGRAGRDGLDAQCVLLYAPGDRKLQELFIENEYPPRETVYRIYDYLRRLDADPIELTHAEIREGAGIEQGDSAVGTAVKILEAAGGLERFLPRENMAIVRINAEGDEPSLVDRLGSKAHVQRIVLLGLESLVDRRFGEAVYFNPENFASSLGLDRPALNRAMKQITTELAVDYVPPFRGNATRVLDRDKRARDLEIDFPALEVRKRREYDKLERMVRYAQSAECRRAVILGYFGDTSIVECGHCDNCEGQGGGSSTTRVPIDTEAGREVLLKALSGVARAKGRFGKTLVAQMLTGSKSDKLARWGLDQLSTFGILNSFRQPEVMQLLDALTRAGLVEAQEVDSFRPIIHLADAGRAFLKDPSGTAVSLDLPTDLAAKIKLGGLGRIAPRAAANPTRNSDEAADPGDLAALQDDPLWERLRDLRRDYSREEKRPAYSIFPDETLATLVRNRPKMPNELLQIKGMGPSRVEKYGQAILDAIADVGTDFFVPPPRLIEREPPNREANTSRAVPPPASPNSAYVPTEEWTWRLLDRGFTPHEAAAIRGLDLSAIVRHATLVARQGRPVRVESFVEADTLKRWRAWIKENRDRPAPDADEMADAWAIFLANEGRNRPAG